MKLYKLLSKEIVRILYMIYVKIGLITLVISLKEKEK